MVREGAGCPADRVSGKVATAIGVVAFLSIAGCLASTVVRPDTWGYLSFGMLFWQGSFPWQDPFSYMPVHDPWVFHEWLVGVVLYPLYAGLGGWALLLVRYALALACAVFLAGAARVRGAGLPWALGGLVACALFFARAFPAVRAQGAGYMFFALLILMLERARREERPPRTAPLVVVFLLWANLHGGFPLGLVVLATYLLFAGRRHRKRSVTVFAACLAATLVNPYGPFLWRAVLVHAAHPQPEIVEWFSVARTFEVFAETPYYNAGLVMLGILVAGCANRLVRDRPAALVLVLTAFLALSHQRHLPFFAFAFAAYAPVWVSAFFRDFRSNRQSGPGAGRAVATALLCATLAAAGMAGAAGGLAMVATGRTNPFTPRVPGYDAARPDGFHYPHGVVAFMRKEGLSGNVLPDQEWGSWLVWTSYPHVRVGMDGRLETVYPEKVRQGYFDYLLQRPGWRSFLDDYPHEYILTKSRTTRRDALAVHPGWRLVFEEPGASLFARDP
ncbi:MAG: hypothetical protein ACLFOY_00735 [Desulfatibacillaceae bacterium]